MGFTSSDIFGQIDYLAKQIRIIGSSFITTVKTFNPNITASGSVAKAMIISPTIIANANGNQLIALDIFPTFVPGSFTNTNQLSLRIPSGGKMGVGGSTTYTIYFATNEVAINAPHSSGNINFQINDGQKARINANGNLLINTTTDVLAADKLQVNGNINLTTAGNKLKIKTGTNASAGTTEALIEGTITVATTAVTDTSIILLTAQTIGGTPGALAVSARTAGTSFTITSSSMIDTSTVGFIIIN